MWNMLYYDTILHINLKAFKEYLQEIEHKQTDGQRDRQHKVI